MTGRPHFGSQIGMLLIGVVAWREVVESCDQAFLFVSKDYDERVSVYYCCCYNTETGCAGVVREVGLEPTLIGGWYIEILAWTYLACFAVENSITSVPAVVGTPADCT